MLPTLSQKSGALSTPERKRRIMSNNKEFSNFQTPDNSITRQEAALPRKRRKTNIMEEFRSISLNNGCLNNNMYGPNCFNIETAPSLFNQRNESGHIAIVPQANSNFPYSQTREESRPPDNVEGMCDDGDDNNNNNNGCIVIETLDDESTDSDDSSEMLDLLSDKEVAERKVMYELALGNSSKANPPKHPVDAKVEEWIRRDMWRRWLQKENGDNKVRANALGTEDDIELDDDDDDDDDETFGFEQRGNNGESLTSPPYMFTKSNSSLSNMETEMEEGDNVMSVDMIP